MPAATAILTCSRHSEASHKTRDELWDYAEQCLTQTAAALRATNAVSADVLNHAVVTVRQLHQAGQPAELLEQLTVRGETDFAALGDAIRSLGNQIASTLGVGQPVIPFADQLIAPSAFYDSFERLHQLGRILITPVIYAENPEAIGIGSINPVASLLLAAEVRDMVYQRFGIHPFVTVARLPYDSWIALARKHFQLNDAFSNIL